MSKNILFLVFFVFQAAAADMVCTKVSLSLKGIEQIAEEKGLSAAIKAVEQNECFDSKRRLIPLLDKVEIMGQEKFKIANWLVPAMTNGEEEISIQMPMNFYSVSSPFQADKTNRMQPCDFNGASGGTVVITPCKSEISDC